MIAKLRNVLRGLNQRWGPSSLKKAAWDQEYASGRWDHCDTTIDAFVYRTLEKYARGGSILDLGCGSGNTGTELPASAYSFYTGVDISQVAVDKAAARSRAAARTANNYEQGDVIGYRPSRRYDVILLRESIYYIPEGRIVDVIKRYAGSLCNDGVFIVYVSIRGTRNADRIKHLLISKFTTVESLSSGDDDFLLVFKPSISRNNA